jgi:coenzyme PQQ biosynthesis protein PqqD
LTRASEQTVPRLATGVRLKLDEARNCWSILAPERVLMPDETALEILRRCNGRSSLSEIIDELAAGAAAVARRSPSRGGPTMSIRLASFRPITK